MMQRLEAWKQRLKGCLATLFFRCVPRHRLKSGLPFGVNLIGYAQAEMGLGEALRNTAWVLENVQIPFLVRKLDVQLLNRQDNHSLDPYVSDYCAYDVNLISINPDLLYRLPAWVGYEEWSRRYNIGYWFWELGNFPHQWRYARYLVDEVWVNTDFVAASVSQVHPRVFKIPFAVEFDAPDARFNRSYFGLPETGFLFLFSYDFNSSAARKNPQAVINTFRLSFPDRAKSVCLVVKSINGEQNSKALAELKESLQDDPRIIWVDGYLSTEEMRGLLNTADAYVSLHRAEGLGLGMAESMYLGKPVIATDYSGNTEFMNAANACMVPYDLIPVEKGEYPHHEGQVWAAPNIDAAVLWMQRLVQEPGLAVGIGGRAATYMREHYSRQAMGRVIASRIEMIERNNL